MSRKKKLIDWDKLYSDDIPEIMRDKYEKIFMCTLSEYLRIPKLKNQENKEYREYLWAKLITEVTNYVLFQKTSSIPDEWRYQGDYVTVAEVLEAIVLKLKEFNLTLTHYELQVLEAVIT